MDITTMADENSRIHLTGLLIKCPYGEATDGCCIQRFRLSVSSSVQALAESNKLPIEDVRNILECHKICLYCREHE